MKGTAAFVKRQSSEYYHPKHTFMITLFYENDKLFNQDTYDNIISQIDLFTLECPTCHHSGCLIKHARYNRTFRVSHSIITVKITRVLCKECGHTHAILLCDFIPYSQILIDDQLDILTNDNDQEILACSNFYKFDDQLKIDDHTYIIQSIITQPELLVSDDPAAENKLVIVMKDENSIQKMMSSFYDDDLWPTENLSVVYKEATNEKEAEDIFNQCLDDFSASTKKGKSKISFYHSSQYEIRQMLMELYGSLFFLGMFLGILFLMATILIMYYKQLSEGYEDQKRFEIMQKVGMSKKEVKQTIRSQILIFFFAPLLVAVMHMAFAFHMITLMMMSFLVTDIQVFIISTVISVVIMTIIYAIVYVFTSRTYYHIVKEIPS